MASPTQRTLELLRLQGYSPWIVEKFNSFSGRRTDLYHIIDIVTTIPTGILGIQSCGESFSEHVHKLMEDEQYYTKKWVRSGGRELILIGWRKLKYKRGGKLMIYKPRIATFLMTNKGQLQMVEQKSEWLRDRPRPKNGFHAKKRGSK